MNVDQILELIAAKSPIAGLVLMALGALVVFGQAIVLLTPSKSDDAWFAKVWSMPILGKILIALASFAPIQKKEKSAE